MPVKPRVLITIDTWQVGGAGKVVLQFLANAQGACQPCVAGYCRGQGSASPFRAAVEALGVPFVAFEQRFAFDPSPIAAALELVRERGIELIESHGYKGHVVALALRRLTGLPWIAYVHGFTSENLKVDGYQLLEKGVVRFADRIVPVSRSLGGALGLGRRALARVEVIANAADPVDAAAGDGRDEPPLAAGEPLIGVVGRLSPEKGHRHFVEAFAALRRSQPRARAVFVGDGQERDKLARQIARHGLGDRITLAGFREDVATFYRACDVIALPSLREGMPNAALEAMAFGKPVVASRTGGIPEVVVDGVTGTLVEPANPARLAAALGDLLADRRKMAAFGARGRERVSAEFSPGGRAGRVIALYHRLLAGNEGKP